MTNDDDALFAQVLAVVSVARVTDFIWPLDELVDFALPERNTEIGGVIGWGAAIPLPATGKLPLGILDGKVVPVALSRRSADSGDSGEQSRESG